MSGTLIVLIVIAVIIIIGGIAIYNSIINKMNAVERGWADVITQERQKNKTLPNLEKIAEQYASYESGLQTQITELRSALQKLTADKMDLATLAETEKRTTSLLNNLYAVSENYPDLKASELFNNLMREIAEQQDNIAAAIRIFNQNVEDFNNTIQVFPNSLVNSVFNKKSKLQTFTDSEAQDGFEYKPNIH